MEQYQLVSWIEGLLEGAFLLETTALLLTYRHRKWRSARLSFASGEKKKMEAPGVTKVSFLWRIHDHYDS